MSGGFIPLSSREKKPSDGEVTDRLTNQKLSPVCLSYAVIKLPHWINSVRCFYTERLLILQQAMFFEAAVSGWDMLTSYCTCVLREVTTMLKPSYENMEVNLRHINIMANVKSVVSVLHLCASLVVLTLYVCRSARPPCDLFCHERVHS